MPLRTIASRELITLLPDRPLTARVRDYAVTPFIFCACLLAGGCGLTTQTRSHPLDRTITIDGYETEWGGLLRRFDDTDLTVGFANDHDHLYLTVVARDQQSVRQITRSGLIIWFSAAAKKERVLGIRYPRGIAASGLVPRAPAGPQDPSVLETAFRATLGEVEIHEGDQESHVINLASIPEIDARATLEFGTIVYELRVPLVRDKQRFGVGARPGSVIAVGFEVPEPDGERRSARPGPRGGSGIAGEGGVAGGTGRLGTSGGRATNVSAGFRHQRLDKWTKLTLAE